jgi:hypothetical protein
MSLEGKVCLITGTAGVALVGCDIKPVDGSDPVDLTDEDAVRRWVDAAAEAHGGIGSVRAVPGQRRGVVRHRRQPRRRRRLVGSAGVVT